MSDKKESVAAAAATPKPVDIDKLSPKERMELVVKEIRSIADGMENGTIKLINAGSSPQTRKIMRKGYRTPTEMPTGNWIITVVYKNIASVTETTTDKRSDASIPN